MEHKLKTWPEFFKHVWCRDKTFELRYDDRGFKAGDKLILREWSKNGGYTGREITATATFLMSGLGLEKDWVAMSLSNLYNGKGG